MSSKPPTTGGRNPGAGDQPPKPSGSSRAPLYAAIVAVVVGLIYFLNTTGMGVLLPEQYNVDLTAEATRVAAATQTAAAEGAAEGTAESVPAPAGDDQAAAPADEEPAASAPADVAAAEAQPESATAEPSATPVPTKSATATPRPTITPVPVGGTSRATATPTFPDEVNGLPTIAYDDLPRQAQETIDLIDEGGPFPFDRDGITFQNREGILPDEFRGYYSEYTVITPGESDRGARRIVAGQDGELYYTDDHYDSFSYVVR